MRGLAASVGAMILIGASTVPSQAELIEGQAMIDTFSGMSLIGVYENGSWFSEIYAPDGTISYVDGDVGHLVGTWEVRGTLFCTDYDGVDGVCLTAEQVSDNCYFFADPVDPKGKGVAAVTEPQGGVYGWNAIQPSTCDATATASPPPPPTASGK